MYLFKSKFLKDIRLVCLISFILIIYSCGSEPTTNSKELKYFDVKGYFSKEIARLSKLNKPVLKSINFNGKNEVKRLFINNWENEFDFFSSSDINKPSWKDSYTIEASENLLIYRAKDVNLKLQEMIVKQVNNKVKWIMIYNNTKNMLYESSEKLSYFPDSLYLIQKSQKVRLLKKNYYIIKGSFK